ncbi:MAG TPA: alpha/beta fold hydrolase [Holophaga sp.]|nr:alpha/beta fold hydrolase [Holophaga sp.]
MLRTLVAVLLLALGLEAAPPFHTKEGQGPGILFIHGFGGNREVWKEVSAALVRDHTVIRVDLPGSGERPGPALVEGGADFRAIARDLAELVAREGIAPCIVVGHSMGGPIAALAVLEAPERFRGLVLVDSFLTALPVPLVEPILQGLDKDASATLEGFYGSMTAHEAQRDRIVAEALQVPVPVLQAYLKGMIRDPFGSRRTDLKLPVAQFAAGPAESDAVKARARLTQAGLDALPRLRVVPFPKSRHWPMWDEPERFLAELRAFEAGLAIR